ncbi:MAG: hypothetical protein ACKVQJ_13605 [Pyrinomonadaceae bacterium]
MYRRPKFLEILLEIRCEMALEADYDVELFAERVRAGDTPAGVAPDTSLANGDTPAQKADVSRSKENERHQANKKLAHTTDS